jgi:hypothetical protein
MCIGHIIIVVFGFHFTRRHRGWDVERLLRVTGVWEGVWVWLERVMVGVGSEGALSLSLSGFEGGG